MKKILKNNLKLTIFIIICLFISITSVYATIQINSNNIIFDNTNANLQKNGVGVNRLNDAIDALYEKATAPCSSTPFSLGDYVTYTPTSSSYSVPTTPAGASGTFNPSELNLWRVININNNCTVELVSEYTSSTDITFSGADGYKNYIYILNKLAKQYADSSHTYTIDPANAPDGAYRIVGYDPTKNITKQITDKSRIESISSLGTTSGVWYKKTTPLNGEESKGGGDEGFTRDLKLLTDAGVSLVALKKAATPADPTGYWLASRLFYWNSTSNGGFSARFMHSRGFVYCDMLYYYGSSTNSGSYSYALRPIVTLKSGLSVSGSGTSSSPYTLSAS